ncbi:unnamed protein product [Rotaria sp. Silwood2]|nr:unnamed protein product [Rotaria sp. Silwood2]CAF2549845.1 unnamed protein product [Rotaria sp. Silwood2]CAF2770176.1 unnamed protein product [Rotaria sp. Silwood2]CAF4260304.1 unnamed protein product [Rotaria sp. Silwood2]CAF4358752.1 unnamed protein product [Rotaria sp. Silwood2]
MSTISHDENGFSHRQGSLTSLVDEEDQITSAGDVPIQRQNSDLSFGQRLSSSSFSNDYSKLPHHNENQSINIEKESQIASIDLEAVPDTSNEDNIMQSWKHLSNNISTDDEHYRNISQSDSMDEITVSFGFQHPDDTENKDQLKQNAAEEVDSTIDYETFVRSRQLYVDPNPELIRKPLLVSPLTYKQNIRIKFLKPPPVPQGPLIIREVRPPQPPPPPPLLIRQRPIPPVSQPPIILREKPPRVPEVTRTQVLTKTLPPAPPPPRSIVIERVPSLPPKPRDIIIERWIPYESMAQKRKVIIQRCKEPKLYPPPKNVIITYDNVQVKVVRQFERLGITPEDPQKYSARYGDSLLDAKDLLAQAKELGITEDLSPPLLTDHEIIKKLANNSLDQVKHEKRFSGNNTTDKAVHSDIDNNIYAPTYENLIDESLSSMSQNEWSEHPIGQENNTENVYAQLAQYGLKKESIPH